MKNTGRIKPESSERTAMAAEKTGDKHSTSPKDQMFVEQRPKGDYAVRQLNSDPESAILPTRAEAIKQAQAAIKRVRELNPRKGSLAERIDSRTGGEWPIDNSHGVRLHTGLVIDNERVFVVTPEGKYELSAVEAPGLRGEFSGPATPAQDSNINADQRWNANLSAYRQLNGLEFVSSEALDAFIDMLWEDDLLADMPRAHVGRNTVVVPAAALPLLQLKSDLKFTIVPVLSEGLPQLQQ